MVKAVDKFSLARKIITITAANYMVLMIVLIASLYRLHNFVYYTDIAVV